MQKNICKKIKYFIVHNKKICIVFLLVLYYITACIDTFARYNSNLNKDTNLKVASLIIETTSNTIDTNLARGKDINHYFSIENYKLDEVSEVAYDYYIFIVDEDNNVIEDATIYKYQIVESSNLITQNNPNTYIEVEKIDNGIYKGGYYGGEFFLTKKEDKFRLEVPNIQKDAVKIKTIAVQKEVVK